LDTPLYGRITSIWALGKHTMRVGDDGSSSGSYLVAGFDITGVEPVGSTARGIVWEALE